MSISIDNNNLYSLYNTNSSGKMSSEKLKSTLSGDLSNATDQELMDVCKDFESYFVEMVLKEMEKTVESSDKNEYTEYFGDTLYQEYAKNITESGSIGLAKTLYESMKRDLSHDTID